MPAKITLHPKFRGQLKPFDLDKALTGATVVTGDRYEVTGLRIFGKQLHGVINGRWPEISQWSLDGTFESQEPGARILDLHIGVPAKVTFWSRVSIWLENFLLGSDRSVA